MQTTISIEMNLEELKVPIDIDHVDFRVQSINKGGYATILAYKDARVDMQRLDDVCGSDKWQRSHMELKGNIYCGIGIKCDDEWVYKWDAGAESFSDKEKGEASDSFKRAGFNWGIGRELYNYPVIQVKLNSNEFTVQSDKAKQTWELKLRQWQWQIIWNDDEVGSLISFDQNNKTRFLYASDIKTLEKMWGMFPEKHKEKDYISYFSTIKKSLNDKITN